MLVPALLPLVFGGQWDEALLTVVGNLVLLGVVRVVVGYGVLSSLWWGLARVTDELGAALLRLVRLLPLLLVFSLVLFYNAEVWQVFDRTHGVADLVLGAFFALLVVLFVALRSPGEAREALAETAARLPGHERATRFSRGQTANLATMIASSQLLQVLVVSLGMGVFFMALGTLTVTPEVMALWDVDGGTWQQTLSLAGGGGVGGADLVVTQTLLRVSVAIATFTGLYYAISVQVDAVYREEFVDGIETQLRRRRPHPLPLPHPPRHPRDRASGREIELREPYLAAGASISRSVARARPGSGERGRRVPRGRSTSPAGRTTLPPSGRRAWSSPRAGGPAGRRTRRRST